MAVGGVDGDGGGHDQVIVLSGLGGMDFLAPIFCGRDAQLSQFRKEIAREPKVRGNAQRFQGLRPAAKTQTAGAQ